MYYNKDRCFGFGLSRQLWLVQFGIFLNTLGWGAVLPFEVIYLHEGRGFSLGFAGLVVGLLTGGAVVAAPVAGQLIDRLGARSVAAGAGVALAAGYAGLAFARSPGVAVAAAAVAGAGNGALGPSQSTLITALTRPDLRHRATAVSRVCTNVGFGLGGALGGVVAASGLNGLVALLLLNAATYLAYVVVLTRAVRDDPRPEWAPGGYGAVLRDRTFLQLAAANVAIIAVGWGVLPWVIPPYATATLGVGPQVIGVLMLANAATVVVAQIPVARWAEGRRRMPTMAVGSAVLALAFIVVLAAQDVGSLAVAALVVAAVAIGVGECFHTTALMPLVADIAPVHVRGRYMATIALSWWIGLAVAPIAGTELLAVSATLAFAVAAAVATAAGAWLLALEPSVPVDARLTPRPGLA